MFTIKKRYVTQESGRNLNGTFWAIWFFWCTYKDFFLLWMGFSPKKRWNDVIFTFFLINEFYCFVCRFTKHKLNLSCSDWVINLKKRDLFCGPGQGGWAAESISAYPWNNFILSIQSHKRNVNERFFLPITVELVKMRNLIFCRLMYIKIGPHGLVLKLHKFRTSVKVLWDRTLGLTSKAYCTTQ